MQHITDKKVLKPKFPSLMKHYLSSVFRKKRMKEKRTSRISNNLNVRERQVWYYLSWIYVNLNYLGKAYVKELLKHATIFKFSFHVSILEKIVLLETNFKVIWSVSL